MTYLAATRAYERRCERATALSSAREQLINELQSALLNDPKRVVMTPGFGQHVRTAAEVALEILDDPKDGSLWHDVMRLIGSAAKGEGDVALQAQLIVSVLARKHAAFHADDLADQESGL